jgi:mxaJ protein
MMQHRPIVAALFLLMFGTASAPVAFRPAAASELRVCADPNNLPFSNAKGEGFENRLAALVARDLKKKVTYVFEMQREHFVKDTLNAGRCDVVMGVPMGFDEADLTRPYYRSAYVFVYRTDRNFGLRSIKDARLKSLKIGVHLMGAGDTPPVQALGREGIVQNVVGYMIYGDTSKPNPPARLIEAVEKGDIDVAAVWGPLGGYFAKHSRVGLAVVPIADTDSFAPLVFGYDIAMGVRRGDRTLRAQLDRIIQNRRAEIRNLLLAYGVPLTEAPQKDASRPSTEVRHGFGKD